MPGLAISLFKSDFFFMDVLVMFTAKDQCFSLVQVYELNIMN